MEKTENAFVLASVRVVCRHWPRVEALPHAVLLIQAFTENISPDALTDVLERGKTHLFGQVLQAMDESLNMVHHEKLREYRYAMYLVIREMTLQKGKLEAMKELYVRYPGSIDSKTVTYVAQTGELPVLRWLHSVRPLSVKKFRWSDETIFKNASIKGRADVVRWVVKLFPKTLRSLEYAAQGGHLNLIKWLMKHTDWSEYSLLAAFDGAVAAGHLTTAKFLYKHKPSLTLSFGHLQLMESLETMKWVHELKLCGFSRPVLQCAVRSGHLEMVQWLHANYSQLFTPTAMNIAAECGHLEIVKFLHANRQDGCTTSAMDSAARNGHLAIVQWLHENRSEGCTANAMDSAAGNGHQNIVQWLHENRSEGCTTGAMDSAARNGHLAVLKWLHANRSEGCTPTAMKDTRYKGVIQWLNEKLGLDLPENIVSAWRGNLEMLKWLHFGRKGSWSKDAMNEAATYGHLDVVKFLHEHRREGCTKKAMDGAAGNNHLEVVRWLHANRREGCSKKAMDLAAKHGHFEMVKWLHAHCKEGCTKTAMSTAAAGGHLKVMKLLDANFSLDWSEIAISHAITHGHAEAVKWLYSHLNQTLWGRFATRAARYGRIRVLEFLSIETDLCRNESVFFVGCGNGHPEVAEWYKDRYYNPRKRKN